MTDAQLNSGLWLTIRITLVATLGGFLFGFDSGVINGTVEGLQVAFESESVGTGFSVASMLLGCAVGAFLAGRFADHYGRRTALFGAAVFFIVSAYGSGIATTSLEFIVYRILGGLAVGAASVMTPAYISEIAPAQIRGRLSTIQQIAIIVGLTAAFMSNYVIAQVAGSSLQPLWFGMEAWRWMFWMEIVPASIFFGALFTIPRSPRFLVLRGQPEEARSVLERLQGSTQAGATLSEIVKSVEAETGRPKISDLLAPSGGIRPVVWVGIGLAVFQQLVGINVIFYYGAVLWQSVGFSEADALATNVITGVISIAACGLAFALIDKIGRKVLLMVGSLGMTATLTTMAIAFQTGWSGSGEDAGLNATAGVIALVSANAYVFFFNISWGPVMWVMLGEMFPNQIRGSGLAVSGLFQWLANFAITMTFPILLITTGLASAYGFYAVSAAISVVFVWKYVSETRGLALEQMEG